MPTITDIYQHYTIPPNLAEHMLRVACVGRWICDHLISPADVQTDNIVKALLLHDMGNLMKYRFDIPNIDPRIETRREYWIQEQQKMHTLFKDEDDACIQRVKEIGASEEVFRIYEAVGSAQTESLLTQPDLSCKIANYSDFRVDPLGVVTVNQRFDDISRRYAGHSHILGQREVVEKRRQEVLALERQIQPHLTIDINSLSNDDIDSYMPQIRSTMMP